MKKLVMLAVLSGMVLSCFGCPPGECGESHSLDQKGPNAFFTFYSCTGLWKATLLDAVQSKRINTVKELLAAGARDHNNEAYNYAVEHGYDEIAELIKNSETQHQQAYNYAIEHGITYENLFANGPTGMPNPTTPEQDHKN